MQNLGMTVAELEEQISHELRDAIEVTDLLAILPRVLAHAIGANNRRIAAQLEAR